MCFVAAACLVAPASPALSQVPTSSSTTTTDFTPPTTTLDPGVDVTGGGRFHGGFAAGQYDLFLLTLDAPVVLVAETNNGRSACAGDTTMELTSNGIVLATDDDSGPGRCSKIQIRLEPGDYEIVVRGFGGIAIDSYYLTVDLVETECGNDVLELLEECDDGNAEDGDCCTSGCTRSADGTPCDNGLDCDGDDTCLSGACTVHSLNPCPGADGDADCSETCSDAAPGCTFPDPASSTCDDGIFCNGADRCHEGSCSRHAGNPCRGPDGDGNCAESCSETGDHCGGSDPDGTPCDDTTFCNGADQCAAGFCSVHAGNPCPGPDGDSNCRESCRESEDECTARDPAGSPCDDGLFCTGTDTCASGACSVHTGNSCAGPDGDSNCAESCSEQTHLCNAPDPAASPCDDGLFCNGADTCQSGACSVHAGNPCPGPDGDGNCSETCDESADNCAAADSNGAPCNDGVFCNGADTCLNGTCSVHAGDPCPGPDGDGNCMESCDESADTCTAVDPNASVCSDGLFCNGTDRCQSGACSTHTGNPCPGPDGDGNCAESCSEAADACTLADPNASPCNDGVFCNGADTCQSGACTGHSGNPCPGPDGDGNCSETCDESADNCAAADSNGAPCNDGVFCNGADTCQGGSCSVHAGNPCPGPDGDGNCAESCNESADNCSAADPNASACNDGLYCNGTDRCQSGACSTHTGNPCPGPDGDGDCMESCNEAADACTLADPNASPCNDAVFCNGADTCQSGACTNHAGNPCPGPDGDGNCAESCDESSDTCTLADMNGSACSDGVFCNGADTCQSGACTVHPGDPCPGVDGDGNCAESCSEAADACTAADPGGSPCSDGLFCNGADNCEGGTCGVHAGNPCPGPDGDGNCAESCSEANDACNAADPTGTSCSDGLFCNGADTCRNGACTDHAGSPCPGSDGDADCAESCSEASDTCSAADANGAACDDGVFCNGTDTCAGGVCGTHSGDPCPGPDGDGNCSESCNEASDTCTAADASASACNDGVFCNGPDTCLEGSCSTHAGDPCPGADGDGNCSETCNEAGDACNAADPNGTTCDDGLFCNGTDTCQSGTCSVHTGNPCTGADGDGNCSESCDEPSDDCEGADPNGSSCDDGLTCNGTDSCLSGACAAHTGNPCPGADGDGDCSESCSDSNSSCNGPDPNGAACDDGIFCNGPDRCSNGACTVHLGNPCPGPDGDSNCAESCNEANDTCTLADPGGSACSDGLFCNGIDTCAAGACTVHAGSPCPGADGDGNCAESCNEAGDACNAPDANGTTCNDGLFCNGVDTCSAGACATHSGSPCAGADGDSNCAESCNETANTCGAPDPNGSACDDGLFCNGADTCSAGACATHTGSPCPGADGDGDCAESCDEAGNACDAPDANGSACDDGVYCNGADTCSAGACNTHAGDPCPGPDGDGNCAESCNEAADACNMADANGSACDDGVFCDGADTCGDGSCSGHAGNPCSTGDGDEDCSESCDEGANDCLAPDPPGAACDDDSRCTTGDECDGAGSCAGSSAVACDDGDECTTDSCSETGDLCAFAPISNCPPSTTTTTTTTTSSTTTTLPDFVCGDVTGDGFVRTADALGVLRSAVGHPNCDDKVCICDVNGNGSLSSTDALLVLRYSVGLPVSLECEC